MKEQQQQPERKKFQFGLEAEFQLMQKSTAKPLWHQDISFWQLNRIFESIDISDLPPMDGIEIEHPHRRLMPYIVEGYHLPDQDLNAVDILPKGVEIRTPVCRSIGETMQVFRALYERLDEKLADADLAMVALSHHPLHTKFHGPKNKRRYDWWQWAMEVMTTCGPDFNISVPTDIEAKIDFADFTEKVNHYAPAMAAISVAAPIIEGAPWQIRERTGKSFRMYKRSTIAPPIEIHPDEAGRLEFKMFDMPNTAIEMENYFLLCLALTLSDDLKGRASKQTMIYDLGNVARHGLEAEQVRPRLMELLTAAKTVLPEYGFKTDSLQAVHRQLISLSVPADAILEQYRINGLEGVMRSRSIMHFGSQGVRQQMQARA